MSLVADIALAAAPIIEVDHETLPADEHGPPIELTVYTIGPVAISFDETLSADFRAGMVLVEDGELYLTGDELRALRQLLNAPALAHLLDE